MFGGGVLCVIMRGNLSGLNVESWQMDREIQRVNVGYVVFFFNAGDNSAEYNGLLLSGK